jgi:hypothetical protein
MQAYSELILKLIDCPTEGAVFTVLILRVCESVLTRKRSRSRVIWRPNNSLADVSYTSCCVSVHVTES